MDNREAISQLESLNKEVCIYSDAIALAIAALKFKENYDKFWEDVKKAGVRGEEVEIHYSGRVFRIREVAQ